MSQITTLNLKTHNDLPEHLRETIITQLNQQLANTLDLFTQVKQAHWNVKGMQFMQLHLLFDDLAESLLEYVDEIAERITALGGLALGTVRIAVSRSNLLEFPVNLVAGKQVVEVLAQRYGAYTSSIRSIVETATEYGDPVTADLFTSISSTLEKHLWMLDAHLQE